MKLLALLSVLLYTTSMWAQLPAEKLKADTTIVGKTNEGADIKGLKFDFAPYNILKFDHDSVNHKLILYLAEEKKKGGYKSGLIVACVDIPSSTLDWQQLLSGPSLSVYANKDFIIRDNYEYTIVTNGYTGRKIWNTEGMLKYIDIPNNIVISTDGVAFDFSTGKKLWVKKMEYMKGWGRSVLKDSNTLLVAAAGLNYIDLRTGDGWYHKANIAEFSKADAKKFLLISNVNKAAISGGYPIDGSDFCSNILVDGNIIYFASANKVECLDEKGTLVWSTSLPLKISGSSQLELHDDNLVMVSTGVARFNGSNVKVSRPYIATYNKNTGRQLDTLMFDEKDFVSDYTTINGKLYVRTYENFTAFDIKTGKRIAYLPVDGTKYISYFDFAESNRLYKLDTEKNFVSFSTAHKDALFCLNYNTGIMVLDSNLYHAGKYGMGDFYIGYPLSDGYSMYINISEAYVLHNGRRVARLNYDFMGRSKTTFFYANDNLLILCELP